MRRAKTETIATAMRILAETPHPRGKSANAAILEAADRLGELQAQIKPPCVWTQYIIGSELHDTACGDRRFYDAGVYKHCPDCGGKITLKRKSRRKS